MMYVFIPKLTRSVTPKQLHKLAATVLAKKCCLPFMERPRLLSDEILEIRDGQGSLERHGLVCIQPESAARWFIKAINKQEMDHKPIQAREYYPREREYPEMSTPMAENVQRLDRRRPNLQVSRVEEQEAIYVQEGLDSFRREYGR